jgi:putative transposase
LKVWRDQRAADTTPNAGKLRKELNAITREQFPWMLEVPKAVVQQAIRNLGTANDNFFTSCSGTRAGAKMGAPDFKSRHTSKQSARLDNGPGTFKCDGKFIKLPTVGMVKTHEAVRFCGKPLSAVVSFVGGRWWVSVQVDIPDVHTCAEPKPSVGIDVGLTTAVTLAHGEKIDAPMPLQAALARITRNGQCVSRKVTGSNNRKKPSNGERAPTGELARSARIGSTKPRPR